MGKTRNNFDALRLIAALCVMVSHVQALAGRTQATFAGMDIGNAAVLVFFAISGYLVSASWRSDPDVRRFITRRFLRVAPGYIGVLALSTMVMSSLGLTSFPMNPMAAVNGSLWTIDYEVICYLVFMVLAMATRHGGPALVLLGTVLGHDDYFDQFAIVFGLGATVSQYPILQRRGVLPILAALGAALLARTAPFWPAALFLTCATLWIGRQSWPLLRDVGVRTDVSYGAYLYAFPVQQLVIMWLGPSLPASVLLACAVPITVAMAWLSWHFVEAPALALKAGLRSDQAKPAASAWARTRSAVSTELNPATSDT